MSKKVTQMSPLHDGKDNVAVSHKEDENMIEAIEDLPTWVSCVDKAVRSCMPSLYCTQGPMLIWGRFTLSGDPVESVRSVNKYYGEAFDRKLAKSPKYMAEAVGVRAIFNPANLFDSYFFRWTTYLDNDEDAGADFRDQKNQEIQNVGLLSALLFTVAYDMMNGVGDSNPETFWGRAYLVSWALSQAFFLAATIMTVVFAAAIAETADESELRLFFSVLDKTTFDYGSMIHIFAMFGGVVFFFLGSIALCYASFEGLGSVLLMGAMIPSFVIAVCVLLATVSALRTARTTTRVLYGGEEKINLSVDHIKQYLEAFVNNNCGGVSLDDLDESDEDFLQYCMAYSLTSDGEVDADFATGQDAGVGGGVKHKGDSDKVYVKRSGQRLTTLAEKRVKQYFNLFLEANLFKTVTPAKFDVIAAQKKK